MIQLHNAHCPASTAGYYKRSSLPFKSQDIYIAVTNSKASPFASVLSNRSLSVNYF